jgi:molybdopterin-dependent oxidoreductase alpha subunit
VGEGAGSVSDRPPVRGETGIASPVPFGLGHQKPHHIWEMMEVAWENRDSLGYAWRILSEGVCDGCSLGPRGLADDVIDGVHLCTTRLRLLRLNTMPALSPSALGDLDRLRGLDNRELQALGRLPVPMLRERGDRGFRAIGWDQALELAGGAIRRTPGPRQAWFATSRGITNEAYYAFTKAARLCGTNNVDLCARLCHQASVSGLKATIGVGAPTCSLSDMVGTDLLLLWGTDMANNQPVTMKYLAHAKARGTRIVVINPVREPGLERYWVPSLPASALFGTRLQDDFVQVRVGGDIALIHGILKALLAMDGVDRAWLAEHSVGWDEVEATVRRDGWEEIEADSGVSRRQIEWIAELYARARTCVSVWSMGITQHTFGTENVEAIAALHLARGMLGREKTGLIPIRGHSGVQGGAECGVGPGILPGGVPANQENRARFAEHWGRPLPEHQGLTTMAMVHAMAAGEIDVLYNVGGNLYAVLPDPAWVARAFDTLKLRIHQDIVVNTSALLDSDAVLLLPAQTRYEQRGGGTSTSTERRVRFSPEILDHPQVGECRPEYEIPAMIATRAFPELASQLGWPDSGGIRAEMERTMPLYAGIAGLRKAGDHLQWGGPMLFADGRFPLPEGRARAVLPASRRIDVPEGAFYLTTRRGKQFNSMVLKDVDRLHGTNARNECLANGTDLARLGLADGAPARVRNQLGSFDVRVRVADVRSGMLQAYWPECNGVVGARVDPRSEEPDYNAVVWLEAR